ncbi:MAG: universal stress protein [Methanoregula sp.]|jgi:nucleotide-binding universal stress UspA family protein
MFKKILFPTDFSKEAKTELHCMSGIPGIREIVLFHVISLHPVPMGTEMIERLAGQTAESYLRMAETYITTLNPDIRVTLEETTSPDITWAILEKAEEQRVDLIVIHANMKGIMTGVILDHIPSKVLCRISTISVMVMPDKLVGTLTGKTYEKFCPMIFSRILCPTDFSELSLKAITLAGTMKGVGEIILLHSVEKSEGGGDIEEAVRAAELRFNAICDNLTAQGIKTRSIVVTGKPGDDIPRIAHVLDVSLIWMRSAAQGCLHDFFFGSIVHDVVMNSGRPVIVIRSIE